MRIKYFIFLIAMPSLLWAQDSYTKLLLHCNGARTSAVFTDSATPPKTVTVAGNAQIDTAQYKFGAASGLFDGAGDYLSLADSADFDFGTNSFTIDLWVRLNAIPTGESYPNRFALFHDGPNSSVNQNAIYITNTKIEFSTSDSVKIVNGSHSFVVNTWYHVAVVRNSDNWNIYIDGASVASAINSVDLTVYANTVTIGCEERGAGDFFNGWLDEYRVSKGIARWTGNFTPPTTAYAMADHYVAQNGGGNVSPYTNWADAANDIQSAANVAEADDTVWVSNGVYNTGLTITPSYSLTNRVCLTNAIILRSINGPVVTIIEGAAAVGGDADANGLGSNAVRCVYLSGGATLIGFTLTNGHTCIAAPEIGENRYGGGVFLRTNCVVSNCVLTGNKAYNYGGGVNFYIGGTLNNCLLVGNYSARYGGGANIQTDGTMNNCTLTGNIGGYYGGGVTMSYRTILNNCVISNNTSTWGPGGVGLWYGGTLNNCLVVGNRVTGYHTTASASGGITCWDVSDVNPPTLNNCTVVNNSAITNGGGIFFSGTTHTNTMNNCIVWGNTCAYDSNSSNIYKTSSTVTVNNTCSGPAQLGAGNIGLDPLLVNTNIGDYRLSANSPCINTGTNQSWMTGAVDRDGRRRIDYFSGHVDMGCYEYLPGGTLYKIP